MLIPYDPEYHERATRDDPYLRLVRAMHVASEIFDIAVVLGDYQKFLEPQTGEEDSHMQFYLGSSATQQVVAISNQEVLSGNHQLVGLQKITLHDDYQKDRFSLIVGTGKDSCIVVIKDDNGITVDCQLNGSGEVYSSHELDSLPEETLQSIEEAMNEAYMAFRDDLDPHAHAIGATLLAETRPYYNYFFHPSTFDRN